MDILSPLKIAVLVNTPLDNKEFWLDVRESWRESLKQASPTAEVDFYDPVHKRNFPDASQYNLVVLSGGKANASCNEPWVLGVLEYVRETVRDHPKTKILGICWGHQALNRALGAKVQLVTTGPIAAVEDVRLTEAGKNFFEFVAEAGFYTAPEFHAWEVANPAPGFIHLAENNECFMNEANTVLTFQAHPEVSHALAKKMLLEEDKDYNRNSSQQQIEEALAKLDRPTHGRKLLERAMSWARG
ncbi:unnamed protein product [Penicillium bialowiezense]